LATYDFIIIPKPGKLNKADALSRRPDYKEGIASENANQILLTTDKFLLTPDIFQICTLHNTAIPTGMDLDLKAALQEGIKADRVTGTKLTSMLTSGPRHITKGLQEWNYEDGLLLYKGLVYVPNNENLKRKVTQLFYDQVMGHLGQWKTIELITQEYWWPGITEFVKAYIKGCAVTFLALYDYLFLFSSCHMTPPLSPDPYLSPDYFLGTNVLHPYLSLFSIISKRPLSVQVGNLIVPSLLFSFSIVLQDSLSAC